MTEDKARKRAIRTRMAKTGERYTAARRHVVMPERLNVEDLGHTDVVVRERTGRGWRDWLRILDGWGARKRTHAEIVRHLIDEHGVSGWWAQSVTIGYERTRGMRAKHQRLGTGFTVSITKTFDARASRLFAAFTDARRRAAWLERGTLTVRTTRKDTTARFDHRDGRSRVVAYFVPKGRAKTTVSLEHERLPDAGAVEEMRAFWKERLARLAETLG
jgi:uncharacterized protein YndB with AHSA1/START domain